MNYQISNLALRHLVDENQVLVNGFINKVQTSENGLLKMKIHTKEGDKNIIINENSFYISNKSIQAKQNPGGFSAFLKKYIFNQRIISIEQKGLDRIVIFTFPDVLLILELFAKGNIILLNKENKILKAMRKEQWKDRKLEINEEYKFPTSKGTNPLEEKENDFIKKMKENKKTSFGAIVEILNVAPRIIEIVFEELNLDKKKTANELTEIQIKKLLLKIKEKYQKKEEKILLKDKTLYSIDVGNGEEFNSLNEALNKLNDVIIKPIETKQKEQKIDYLKEIQEQELNISTYKEKGNFIYEKYAEIDEIIKAIKQGQKKGLTEKEIKERINLIKNVIKEIDFKKNKVTLKL